MNYTMTPAALAARRRGGQTTAARGGAAHLGEHARPVGRWAREHDQCRTCGTTDRPHRAHGDCTSCSARAYRNAAKRGRDGESR